MFRQIGLAIINALLIMESGLLWASQEEPNVTLPPGFVYLHDIDATIQQDLRYVGAHNFLGRPVKGYGSAKCILTKPAAEALSHVQNALLPYSLSLKVYDCYRPQTAVDDFVAWAQDLTDQAMKPYYYPRIKKDQILVEGYIAEKSGHSRGSTLDLTLVPVTQEPQTLPQSVAVDLRDDCTHPKTFLHRDNSIDMGTAFDCFDPLSYTEHESLSNEARINRMLLKRLMMQHGFKNLPQEWWHYTLIEEPFPEQYFDFPIQ